MSSTSRSALLGIEEASRDLALPVRRRLAALCRQPDVHARFLNTLSLLEHIGSRKIMASQSGGVLAQDMLKHLAEETRHAFFFKRAAEGLACRALSYGPGDTLAGAGARMYMGRLDAHIGNALGEHAPAESAYLYMSLIVELRAVWFYRIYRDAVAEHGVPISLKSVLAEEEVHLDAMMTRLADFDVGLERRTRSFSAFEAGRFRDFWNAMEIACNAASGRSAAHTA